MITFLLFLLAGHFIGDFAFQSEYMALQKGKSWEWNGYHALTYACTVFALAALGGTVLPFWAFAALAVSHFFIDPLKARWGIIKFVWLDQLLHFTVLLVLVVLIRPF